MASSMLGKLDVEVELKSPAPKYWDSIIDSNELFPKAFPQQYKSIEVLEGDGKAPGSIRKISYGEGVPFVTSAKERVDAVDLASKTISYSVIDGEILSFYKTFIPTFQVVANDATGGCTVKWTVAYEKASEDVPAPDLIAEMATKTFADFDEYVMAN